MKRRARSSTTRARRADSVLAALPAPLPPATASALTPSEDVFSLRRVESQGYAGRLPRHVQAIALIECADDEEDEFFLSFAVTQPGRSDRDRRGYLDGLMPEACYALLQALAGAVAEAERRGLLASATDTNATERTSAGRTAR